MNAILGTSALALLAMPLAFVVGFALKRGSVCMVEGTRQAIVFGRTLRLRAFIVAAGAAGCTILPIAWLLPGKGMLAPDFALTPWVIVGGTVFGVGARINGGCQFGTIGRLAGGETNYVFTCAGAIVGAAFALRTATPVLPEESPLMMPSALGFATFILFAALALPGLKRRYLRNIGRIFRDRRALMSPVAAMLVVGTVGGILYTLAGSWTAGALLNREGAWLLGEVANHADIKVFAGGVALVGGALFAAIRSGRFRLCLPSIAGFVRNGTGGILMGAGAALVPGGNGTLLLYSIPSASLTALAAFAAMTATIALGFLPARLAARR